MEKPSLLGMLPEEIAEALRPSGAPSYRADQVFRWVQKRRVGRYDEMTNVPSELRAALAERYVIDPPSEVRASPAPGGDSRKLLYRMGDGVRVEAVLIAGGDAPTLCVSSQAGCAYECAFCATAVGGLRRSLRAGEIVGQVLAAEETPKRIVYMGMGEPLANYRNVVKSIRILTHPEGLGMAPRRITVSTVGLVPLIDRLAAEGLGVRLAVSLFSADDSKRSRFMPVNRKYPVDVLLESAGRYARASGRPVTFEYPMLAGVNDGRRDAELLIRKLNSLSCKVNLIPWNRVEGIPHRPPSEEALDRFLAALSRRLTVTVRRSAGREIDAACGQLRLRDEREGPGR